MNDSRTHLERSRQKSESNTEAIMACLTPTQASGTTSELKISLKNSHLRFDEARRFLQVMTYSPAALGACIRADAALVRGHFMPHQRQQGALAVAEINRSGCNLSRPPTQKGQVTIRQ